MKSSVGVVIAAVVLGAALMFCANELMKATGGSPSGQSPGTNPAGDKSPEGGQNAGGESAKPTESADMKLVKGKRYRMMIVSARLPATKPSGKAWDIGSGLPDCFFKLKTPDNHYASSKVSDCLAPNWADKSLSVRDLWSGRVRVSNEGAVFIYDPDAGGKIHLDFLDTDLTMNDSIGNLVLAMTDLRPGYTEYKMSYSPKSLDIYTGKDRKPSEMLFTVRIIPDGM